MSDERFALHYSITLNQFGYNFAFLTLTTKRTVTKITATAIITLRTTKAIIIGFVSEVLPEL